MKVVMNDIKTTLAEVKVGDVFCGAEHDLTLFDDYYLYLGLIDGKETVLSLKSNNCVHISDLVEEYIDGYCCDSCNNIDEDCYYGSTISDILDLSIEDITYELHYGTLFPKKYKVTIYDTELRLTKR